MTIISAGFFTFQSGSHSLRKHARFYVLAWALSPCRFVVWLEFSPGPWKRAEDRGVGTGPARFRLLAAEATTEGVGAARGAIIARNVLRNGKAAKRVVWLPLPTPPPPKPPRDRQNVPVDGRVPLLHHPPVVNAARNQFSLTRVASKPAAWRKSKFLSVLPDLGTISTLARQGTADTLLQVGSDTNADPGSSLLEPDS